MKPDDGLIDGRDIPAAISFLTRVPIAVDGDWAACRGARTVWAYPLAGLCLGLVVAVIAFGLLQIGLPPSLAAAVALAASVFITGALHEDGLADTCDGLWGGWTRERRLEIMKDSRIGAYGVLALVLSLLLRWQGYTVALEAGWLWALIALPALSRALMTPLMRMGRARSDGVSAAVGTPPTNAVCLALGLTVLMVLPLGSTAIWLLLGSGLAALAMARLAQVKIGGQTGDILGATQQVTEITGLLILSALIA